MISGEGKKKLYEFYMRCIEETVKRFGAEVWLVGYRRSNRLDYRIEIEKMLRWKNGDNY